MSETLPAPRRDLIHTRIWHEQPEPDNPFATRSAHCRGYDVFGAMVGRARWVEMLYLLLRDEAPAPASLAVLEALAVALANPGPRDASVHAAMCGAVGGSTAAAALIAALSVGAGRAGGARDVHDAMDLWLRCGPDLAAWHGAVAADEAGPIDAWPARSRLPGFDPHGVSTPTVVRQLLGTLVELGGAGFGAGRAAWLLANLAQVQADAGLPLTLSGAAAAVLCDLGLSPDEGEMLYLLLRLPGAAAHALEQKAGGYKNFPFYPVTLHESGQQNGPNTPQDSPATREAA